MKSKVLFLFIALSGASCSQEAEKPSGHSGRDAASGVCAHAAPGKLSVENAWVREATEGAKMSAAYFTLCNQSSSEKSLIDVEANIAHAEIHESTRDENGVVSMSPRESMSVSPDGSLGFRPGGAHIMLIGVSRPIAPGDKIPLTLRFAGGQSITVEAEARSITGQANTPSTDQHH